MTVYLCKTCGTSFPDAAAPPHRCLICEDERQFVPAGGQEWMTREALASGHRNAWHVHEPDLFSLQTVPAFAIDQRAFLLRTPAGNVLWDCIALLDDATKELIRSLGGLHAIAISHPHYYTTVADWAAAFDASVYLHAKDREWIVRPDPAIRLWDGEAHDLLPGVTLVHVGGHFAGGTALHWADGAQGKGVLLTGDVVQVNPGGDRVSFMWSYPNLMPLPAATIREITARISARRFERIYGAFLGREIMANGQAIFAQSAARYIELLEGRKV